MAMQRMAEQEREMAKIQEAAKQTYLQQQQGLYTMYLPYGYAAGGGIPPPYSPGMPPQQPGIMLPGQHPQLGMVPSAAGQQPMGMLPPAASAAGQQQQQPMGAAPTAVDGSGGATVAGFNPSYAQQPQQPMYYGGMMAGGTGTLPTPGTAGAVAPVAAPMGLPGAPYNMQGLAAALPQQQSLQSADPQQQQQHLATAAGGADTTLISFD
jgi:hypothetical protein